MMKILKSKPWAVIAIVAGASLSASSGFAHAGGHGGCYVTASPTESARGIRHWRPSCAEWYKRIEQLRPAQADPGEAPWVHVVVRKINLPASRITVSHGAIPQIDMPAMTISFPVTDKARLATLREGVEVDIQCEHRGGVVRVVNFRI